MSSAAIRRTVTWEGMGVTTPEDFNNYDDALYGYDWSAHLVLDGIVLLLTLGSAAGLAWITLIRDLCTF
jgi:hypothetical protein